jgi:hypothetical protein
VIDRGGGGCSLRLLYPTVAVFEDSATMAALANISKPFAALKPCDGSAAVSNIVTPSEEELMMLQLMCKKYCASLHWHRQYQDGCIRFLDC